MRAGAQLGSHERRKKALEAVDGGACFEGNRGITQYLEQNVESRDSLDFFFFKMCETRDCVLMEMIQ